MKESTKDQVKGAVKNLKGKIREAAGVVTGQHKLESKGKGQQRAGRPRRSSARSKRSSGSRG
jgi:uncharacterized protein YjbJ (UPF0337 family)